MVQTAQNAVFNQSSGELVANIASFLPEGRDRVSVAIVNRHTVSSPMAGPKNTDKFLMVRASVSHAIAESRSLPVMINAATKGSGITPLSLALAENEDQIFDMRQRPQGRTNFLARIHP